MSKNVDVKGEALASLVKLHHNVYREWREGRLVEVFFKDGFPCVKYESGKWWHYDVKRQCWW